MHVIAGKVVVQQPGGNPVIPLLRRNIAARTVAHKGLRNGQIQPLLAYVQALSRIFNRFGQRHAGIGRQRAHAADRRGIQPHSGQLAARQAGKQPLAVFAGVERHITGRNVAIVQVDIDAVGPRRQFLPLLKTGEIRYCGRIVGQKTGVKIQLRLGEKSR